MSEGFVSMEDSPRFHYQPLVGRDIRILRVEPGPIGSPVRCTLEHVPFESGSDGAEKSHRLICLSYVWGSPEPDGDIAVNGRPFTVKHNLLDALDKLRTHCGEFTQHPVWVDAICINQSDVQEKSRQVLRMTDIYLHAEGVVAWLGLNVPEQDSSTLQFNFAMAIACWPSESEGLLEGEIQRSKAAVDDRKEITVSAESLVILKTFLDHPWFHRVWTFQEAVSGRRQCRLYCGGQSVPLNCLLAFGLAYLESTIPHPTTDEAAMLYGLQLIVRTRKVVFDVLNHGQGAVTDAPSDVEAALGLLRLLCSSSVRDCGTAHDYMYGILGLWKFLYLRHHEMPSTLYPDYSQSFETTCHRYASYLIMKTGALRVFSMSRPCLSPGIPSWVPNFAEIMPVELDFLDTESTVSISSDMAEVTVNGYLIGHCLDGWAEGDKYEPLSDISKIQPWLARRLLQFEKEYIIPAAQIKRCPAQQLWDSWLKQFQVMNRARFQQIMSIYRSTLSTDDDPGPHVLEEEDLSIQEDEKKVFQRDVDLLIGGLLGPQFLLDSGDIVSSKYLATTLKKGDKVFYLQGAKTLESGLLHTLRPISSNRYRLLGMVFLTIHDYVVADWNTGVFDKSGMTGSESSLESLILV
ncbi:heterokaryon incompatibility protein-domain-containing protein [Xylariales sp. PMI_506]|nr:heterokaryon incompatibility protein-domain-containing protein [Xylariales sp. PMI_506]